MLGRKREFRPDRVGSGFLNKLYLTKRQRRALLMWLLYTLALVALSLVQDVILCRISILGATTDLVSAGILLLCIMLPTDTCAVFAVTASAIFYFSGSAAGPYSILFLTGIGILLNIFRCSYLRKSFGSTFFCAAAALFLYELLIFVAGLFLGHTTTSRWLAFCITGGLSAAVMPLLYPIFSSIGNIGGESWKE